MKLIKQLLDLKKRSAELRFWQSEIEKYHKWYTGELPKLYMTPSPKMNEKVNAQNEKDASILTWHKLHQETKYLEDLDLKPDAFSGMKLLEVGSGPMPSATCFKGSRLFCLEPLLPRYLQAGFPIHYYEGVTFINASAENIPVIDGFFDAVISVNAIDHVDDIRKTSKELSRVLKKNALFRMHVHYHSATTCEPIEINDELFMELFGWCDGLKKVKESTRSHSAQLPANQKFVVWSNF